MTIASVLRYCACSVLALVASDVWAQEAAENSARASSSSVQNAGFEDIIVTAQKRKQSLNSIGMTITAASIDQLRSLGIVSVGDLAKLEPSFVASNSAYGRPYYQIRGVGFNSDAIGAPPAVSVYVDEVPYPFALLSRGATLDLERVEILKGPQGTLFGQNATGGAVNYIAAKPTDALSLGVDATYARFNSVKIDGFLSGPITETLKARVAASIERGGAWQYSVSRPGDKLGDKNNKYARLLLDWQPADKLQISVNLNGWTNNSEPQAPTMYALALQFPTFASYVPEVVNEPIVTGDARAADWAAQPRPKNDEDFYQASLRADYDIADNAQLTYLGTYQHYKQNDIVSYSGTPAENYIISRAKVTGSSHELRVAGKLLDGKVDWLIGGNYSRFKDRERLTLNVAGITTAFATSGALLPTYGPLRFIEPFMTQDMETQAVFGNLEFHVLDNLSIRGGVRYTKATNDHKGCQIAPDVPSAAIFSQTIAALRAASGLDPIPPFAPGDCMTFDPVTLQPLMVVDSLKEDNVSWRFGVDWSPINQTLIYANVSRGYKAGSFPNIGATLSTSLLPAKEEEVTAYEAGFKSRLADKLQINGAVFYYDYKDKQQQLRVPDPRLRLLNALLNVPKSRQIGVEVAVNYHPIPGLTIDGSATYLDSKVVGDFFNYTQFALSQVDTANFRDEPLPNTPKWALQGGIRYEWSLGENHDAFVGVNARYQSKTQSAFGAYQALDRGFPSMVNPSYALLDLRAGASTKDNRWHLEVFGDNVTNKYYVNQSIRLDTVARFAGMPATYGVRVGYRY